MAGSEPVQPDKAPKPSEMQELLRRAVASLQNDSAASNHEFIKSACTRLEADSPAQLLTALNAMPAQRLCSRYALAVRDGFDGALPTAGSVPKPVQDLAVALGLAAAERLVLTQRPTGDAAAASPVPVDDSHLAAIVAAGWQGVGLQLVMDPGKEMPAVANLIDDMPELQAGVCGPGEALNQEVRDKLSKLNHKLGVRAAHLMRLPAPPGPGSEEGLRADLDSLFDDTGLRLLLGLKAGADTVQGGQAAWQALASHISRNGLNVAMFRYGSGAGTQETSSLEAWGKLEQDVRKLLNNLRATQPLPRAHSRPPARIFISYSHKDETYLKRLLNHLPAQDSPLQTEVWSDKQIEVGDRWHSEIDRAMTSCRVAVLLISEHFMNSRFITKFELPTLLKRREAEGLVLVPIMVRHYDLAAFEHLRSLQAINMSDTWEHLEAHDQSGLTVAASQAAKKIAELAQQVPPYKN